LKLTNDEYEGRIIIDSGLRANRFRSVPTDLSKYWVELWWNFESWWRDSWRDRKGE
jgi:hypothetical protein